MEQHTAKLVTPETWVEGDPVPEGWKRCPGHKGEHLPLILPQTNEFFYTYRRSQDNLQPICIDCSKAQARNQCTDPNRREAFIRKQRKYKQLLKESISDGWEEDEDAIKDRDGHWCYLCDSPILNGYGSFDHVVPLGKSKDNRSTNVRYTHLSCNCSKAGLTLEELVANGTLDAGVFERVKL